MEHLKAYGDFKRRVLFFIFMILIWKVTTYHVAHFESRQTQLRTPCWWIYHRTLCGDEDIESLCAAFLSLETRLCISNIQELMTVVTEKQWLVWSTFHVLCHTFALIFKLDVLLFYFKIDCKNHVVKNWPMSWVLVCFPWVMDESPCAQ